MNQQIGKIELPPAYPPFETDDVQLEREARRRGRIEMAVELATWANKNYEELSPRLLEELANMILSAPNPRSYP